MGLGNAANSIVFAGGGSWRANLAGLYEGASLPGTAPLRRAAAGQGPAGAIPVRHAQRITIGSLFQGPVAETVQSNRDGYAFLLDPVEGCWIGGGHHCPSDARSVSVDSYLTRQVDLVQSGAWGYGVATAKLSAVTPIALTPSKTSATKILLNTGGIAWLLLSKAADSSVRLSAAGRQSTATAIKAAAGVVPLRGLGALASSPARDVSATLTASGLSSSETLVGWLLTGVTQGID